jgi:hypothetical protein
MSVFCLLFAFYNLSNPTGDPKLFYLIAFLPILYIVIFPFALGMRAKAMWKNQELFQKKFKYKFDAEGIQVSSAAGKGTVEWHTLHNVFLTKEDFIFYVAKAQAFIVPLKAMETAQVEKLTELLQKNLPEEKLKL